MLGNLINVNQHIIPEILIIKIKILHNIKFKNEKKNNERSNVRRAATERVGKARFKAGFVRKGCVNSA